MTKVHSLYKICIGPVWWTTTKTLSLGDPCPEVRQIKGLMMIQKKQVQFLIACAIKFQLTVDCKLLVSKKHLRINYHFTCLRIQNPLFFLYYTHRVVNLQANSLQMTTSSKLSLSYPSHYIIFHTTMQSLLHYFSLYDLH